MSIFSRYKIIETEGIDLDVSQKERNKKKDD